MSFPWRQCYDSVTHPITFHACHQIDTRLQPVLLSPFDMKPGRFREQYLSIQEVFLSPGAEWVHASPGWVFVYVSSGTGYWLGQGGNHELATGASIVVAEQTQGCFRVSQTTGGVIDCFRIQLERLTGLATLSEHQFLQAAASQERFAFRIFPPTDPVCERFRQLRQNLSGHQFSLRLRLLELFIATFGQDFGNQQPEPPQHQDARVRLKRFLERMVASELVEVNFASLARQMRCTPRHLSRTFHEVVGMSFRDKQSELRLVRARNLLATTKSKVLNVALESGYQSASFFNQTFKRRFGVSPGRWRKQINVVRTSKTSAKSN
jgi:AraC-like DNA-binding protein